jgi:hypothetical protein
MSDNAAHDVPTALAAAPPARREHARREHARIWSEHGRFRRFLTRFGGVTAAFCLLVAAAVYYGVFSDHAGWWAPGEPVAPGDHTMFDVFTLGITVLAVFGAGLGLLCALASRGPVVKLVWATIAALTVLALIRSNLHIGPVLHQVFAARGFS